MDHPGGYGSFALAERAFDSKIQNNRLMCDIYHAYLGDEGTHHNCLGDNFNDLTGAIHKFLRIVANDNNVFDYQESFAILSHLINSMWERIEDILNILGVPASYRCRHYRSFIRIRRWANFFKHPKEFAWLVCFPKWCIEGSPRESELTADKAHKIVDDGFLKKYYMAERDKGLAKEFEKHSNKVVVVLPDVVEIIENISDELADFVTVVTKNPVYH